MAGVANGVMTQEARRMEAGLKRLAAERRRLRAACRVALAYLQGDVTACEDAGDDLPDDLVQVLTLLTGALHE